MRIVLIGVNHKSAPLELREKLCLAGEKEADLLAEIMNIPQVKEALYLSTCNRVEILASLHDQEDSLDGLRGFMLRQGNLSPGEMERCVYIYEGSEAVRHLFRVASSIDSLVMGEAQILGQVKEAYRFAAEKGATGIILNKILHQAFRVAKRVRTETAIAQNAVSVSYAAVSMAKKIFGDLKGKKVLLVGAGEMSELAARQLIKYGAARIIIANRTYSRAVQLADQFNGEAIGFDLLHQALADVDIVITSTGATGYVIGAELVARAVQGRKNRLLFLIDIAVPRDIDPRAGDLENVFLYNIDNLQEIVDENFQQRNVEAQKAQGIIDEEIAYYLAWLGSLGVVPTISSLRAKFDGIMKGELERSSSWLGRMGEENRRQVEILLASVINKLLHDPVVTLKEESGDNGAAAYIAAVRRLFRLEEK
ncbi:MAG: glutamyl-tRNA reductase [Smithellaceae bacterium]|nr:glutamyl-tRNA reductase [Smithellaceae bacterium]